MDCKWPLGQAEHDNLAQCILISKDKLIITKINEEINKQLKDLPRKKIIKNSLFNNGILIHMSSEKQIVNTVNKIAPEL